MKQSRHPVILKLSLPEYAALSADAKRVGLAPTTMVLIHVLAGLQSSRLRFPDLDSASARAATALAEASRSLVAAGCPVAASAAGEASAALDRARTRSAAALGHLVAPGWRLDAYRHRIAWDGEDAGRPLLD